MGEINLDNMRGHGVESENSASEINRIFNAINRSGNKYPNAILYLGQIQKYAIKRIENGDIRQQRNDNEFCGWPVIWVQLESYVRFI